MWGGEKKKCGNIYFPDGLFVKLATGYQQLMAGFSEKNILVLFEQQQNIFNQELC